MYQNLVFKSEYNFLNSIAKMDYAIEFAVNNGMTHLGICDYNNMFGCYDFESKCNNVTVCPMCHKMVKEKDKLCKHCGTDLKANPCIKEPLKHTMGLTLTVQSKYDETKFFNLQFIAKNKDGYFSLVNLSTLANIGGKQFPYVTLDDIKNNKNGLICLTGGLIGELFNLVVSKNDKWREYLKELMDIFKEDLWIEFTNHNIPEEKIFNKYQPLHDFISQYNLNVVGTQHVHYIKKEYSTYRAIALDMNANPAGYEFRNKYTNYNDEFYFKNEREMNEAFKSLLKIYPNILENNNVIASICDNVEIPKEKALPEFPCPNGLSDYEYLKQLVWEGFYERFSEEFLNKDNNREMYENQLKLEFDVITQMGFTSYFLIVRDYINWCKDSEAYLHPEVYFPKEYYDMDKIDDLCTKKDYKIFVGPGRGSAAGSLLAYCLKITEVLDPVENRLFFERFLNPERVSMPDIDTDFSNRDREKVVQYVQNKYGFEKVAQIVTFSKLGPKSLIKSVGKALGLSFDVTNNMTKEIPMTVPSEKDETEMVPVTTMSQLERLEYFDALLQEDETVQEVFKVSKILEGLPQTTGKHAAGVIIGCKELTNYLPLMEVDGVMVTQFEKKNCEDMNLLKMDFLGLKTEDVIQETLSLIKENFNHDIDIDNIDWKDQSTFEMLSEGLSGCVFQFEGNGMKNLLKQIKPTSLDHLYAATALFRPGPMQFIPKYIEGRNDNTKIEWLHPLLKEMSADTFGILVYQEQLMQAVQILAGYSLGRADLLRRIISKKDEAKLAKEKEVFIQGCWDTNKITREEAEKVFAAIEPFARYGFNKAHSAAYGIVSYQTAWLKANYHEAFMCANLTNDADDADRLAYDLAECKRIGLPVLPPDVRYSKPNFSLELAEYDGEKRWCIRYGLKGIKTVGEDISTVLTEAQDKSTLNSIISEIPHELLRSNQLLNLIKSGTFDCFGVRKSMIEDIPNIVEQVKMKHEFKKYGIPNFIDELPKTPLYTGAEYAMMDKLTMEKAVINTTLSGNILTTVREMYPSLSTIIDLKETCEHGVECKIPLVITDLKKYINKKGNTMMFTTLEDETSSIEGVIFSKELAKLEDKINQLDGAPALFDVIFNKKGSGEEIEYSLVIKDIIPVISNNKKLYIEKSTLTPELEKLMMNKNGIMAVCVIDSKDMKIEEAPYKIIIDTELMNYLNSSKVKYKIKSKD